MPSPTLKKSILALLAKRGPTKTICPSELLDGAEKKNQASMAKVREAAIALAEEGKIEICQKGKAIDPNKIHGPIRLKLKT